MVRHFRVAGLRRPLIKPWRWPMNLALHGTRRPYARISPHSQTPPAASIVPEPLKEQPAQSGAPFVDGACTLKCNCGTKSKPTLQRQNRPSSSPEAKYEPSREKASDVMKVLCFSGKVERNLGSPLFQ